MVIVSGTLTCDPGKRDEVIAAIELVEAETQTEEGCISYRFYPDREDENTFRVFEEWRSQDALERHSHSTHLAAFRETLKTIGLASRDVKAYTVTDTKVL